VVSWKERKEIRKKKKIKKEFEVDINDKEKIRSVLFVYDSKENKVSDW